MDLKLCNHVTLALQELQWLPVTDKIHYKSFTSPQVASWTQAGLHLGLTDTSCRHDLQCTLDPVATSSYPRHIDELVIGLSALLRHEDGTGCSQ